MFRKEVNIKIFSRCKNRNSFRTTFYRWGNQYSN